MWEERVWTDETPGGPMGRPAVTSRRSEVKPALFDVFCHKIWMKKQKKKHVVLRMLMFSKL